ncbi:MAG: hypothetical protein WCG42_08475, partial [Parachlamydiaceae bacterium]
KKEEAPIPAEKLEEFMQTKANLEKKIAELHGQIIRVNTQLISKDLSERHCIKTMDWLEKQASNLEATAMTASQRLAEKMQETAFQTQQIMYRDMHIHSLAGHLGVTVGQILPHQQHEIHALNQHLQSAHGTIQDQAEEIHKLRQQLQETTQPVRASHSKIEQIHEALPTRRFSTSFERLTVNMAEVTSRDLTPFDEICESFGRSPSDFGGTVYCKMIYSLLNDYCNFEKDTYTPNAKQIPLIPVEIRSRIQSTTISRESTRREPYTTLADQTSIFHAAVATPILHFDFFKILCRFFANVMQVKDGTGKTVWDSLMEELVIRPDKFDDLVKFIDFYFRSACDSDIILMLKSLLQPLDRSILCHNHQTEIENAKKDPELRARLRTVKSYNLFNTLVFRNPSISAYIRILENPNLLLEATTDTPIDIDRLAQLLGKLEDFASKTPHGGKVPRLRETLKYDPAFSLSMYRISEHSNSYTTIQSAMRDARRGGMVSREERSPSPRRRMPAKQQKDEVRYERQGKDRRNTQDVAVHEAGISTILPISPMPQERNFARPTLTRRHEQQHDPVHNEGREVDSRHARDSVIREVGISATLPRSQPQQKASFAQPTPAQHYEQQEQQTKRFIDIVRTFEYLKNPEDPQIKKRLPFEEICQIITARGTELQPQKLCQIAYSLISDYCHLKDDGTYTTDATLIPPFPEELQRYAVAAFMEGDVHNLPLARKTTFFHVAAAAYNNDFVVFKMLCRFFPNVMELRDQEGITVWQQLLRVPRMARAKQDSITSFLGHYIGNACNSNVSLLLESFLQPAPRITQSLNRSAILKHANTDRGLSQQLEAETAREIFYAMLLNPAYSNTLCERVLANLGLLEDIVQTKRVDSRYLELLIGRIDQFQRYSRKRITPNYPTIAEQWERIKRSTILGNGSRIDVGICASIFSEEEERYKLSSQANFQQKRPRE